MVKLGYSLNELYEYSMKELLFMLKYKREGLAYEIWRNGTMSRAAQCKDFPTTVEKAIPEMFEKGAAVPLEQLPPEIREMFVKTQQEQLNDRFGPKY